MTFGGPTRFTFGTGTRFGNNNTGTRFGGARLFTIRNREVTYSFRTPAHILFSRPDNSDSRKLAAAFAKPNHEKSLYILNPSYKFDVFNFIDKTFTINTQKGSYKFNKDFLADTSQVINAILVENPQNLQYQLNIADEVNIMEKVEKMYQGETIKIEDSELYAFKLISDELDISNSLKNMRKNISFGRDNRGISDRDSSSSLKIMDGYFYSYLKDTMPKTFTIVTKNKEYNCNIIGINSSKVLHELVSKDPTLDRYEYDFDDECNEFQPICDFFNFNIVPITADNMNSLKTIAEELQIDFILTDINNYIEDFEKRIQTIDDQQSIIDSIDELFEILYTIDKTTVESAKNKIILSPWSKTDESVQELAAFILQVIRTDILLQPYMADLLEELNKDANDENKLEILIPFIVQKLMESISESLLISSFITLMCKKGFIKKEEIIEEINKFIKTKRPVKTLSSRSNFPESFMTFLPELYQIKDSDINQLLDCFPNSYQKFIKLYIPDKIESFIEMRDKFEPDDSLTKALRNDDVDTIQSIISKSDFNFADAVVPFDIFEGYVPNGETNYINYAAAYGSLKCFKYLLLNHAPVTDASFSFAVFGGNIEIIKVVDQKLSEPGQDSDQNKPKTNKVGIKPSFFSTTAKRRLVYEKIIPAIKKHKNDLFDWIIEQKFPDFLQNKELISNIMITASKNGDSHSIATIVDKGFDFSIFDKTMCTEIIQNAAINGFYQLLQLISLVLNKNIEQYSDSLQSIFDSKSSILFGNFLIFDFYQEKSKKYDINIILSTAVTHDYKKIIDYIFENLIDENKTKINYHFQLSNAISLKTDDYFNYLLDKFEKIEPNPILRINLINLLSEACILNKFEIGKKITDLILKYKKEDENPNFSLPFYNAATSGSTELCQFFVDQKVHIDYKLISLQVQELAVINKDILEIIVKNMPPKAKNTFTACYLEEAIRVQNKSFIEYLLNEKAIYDEALFDAARTKDIDIVNMILNHHSEPAFINQTSTSGTALNIAVLMNDLPIVKRLLSVPGIDPSLYEGTNETPLITAITTLNIDIINAILDFYGENIKSQSWQLDDAVKKFLNILSSEKRRSERPNKSRFSFSKATTGLTLSQRLTLRKVQQGNDQQNDDSKFLAVLNRFLEIEYIDLNCHSDNYTLFTYACEANEIDIVEMMLENPKVDVNSYAPTNGNTPLLIAIDKQNIEIVKLLIESDRININQRNYQKETALIMAVRKNLLEIIDLIINNKKFNPIESRLDFAFYESDGEAAKKLSKVESLDVNYKLILRNADKKKKEGKFTFGNNKSSTTITTTASLKERLLKNATNKGILSFGCTDELKLFSTTLINAVQNSKTELVDLIIHHPSFDPEKSLAKEAVISACTSNKAEIFKKLMELFDNDFSRVEEPNNTLIQIAIQEGSGDVLDEILHNKGMDLTKYNLINLFVSAFRRPKPSYGVMDALIEFDKNHDKIIDFNCKLPNGNNFFTSVPSELDEEINQLIEYFINHGADPNIPDEFGVYPLIYAIKIHSIEYVNSLILSGKIDFNKKLEIKSKPEYDVPEAAETTYLHLIVGVRSFSNFNDNILETIIGSKLADINATDSNGETSLMCACRYYNRRAIRRLFDDHDLDYQKTNNNGDDALKICKKITGKNIEEHTNTREEYMESLLEYIKGQKLAELKSSFRNKNEDEDNDFVDRDDDDKPKFRFKIPAKENENKKDEEKENATKEKSENQNEKEDKKSEINSPENTKSESQSKFEASKSETTSNEKPTFGANKFGGQSKFGAAKLGEQSSGGEKPAFGANKFGGQFKFGAAKSETTIYEKPTFGSNKFGGQSKFGAAKLGEQSSGDEKPAFGSNKFGNLSKFGAAKSETTSDEKPTFGANKFGGQSKFGAAKLGEQSSGDEKPAFGANKFGGQFKFGAAKSETTSDEKPTFGANKFGGQSKFGAATLGEQSSGDEKPATPFGSSKFVNQSKFGAAKLGEQSSGDEKPTLSAHKFGAFKQSSKATDEEQQISTRSTVQPADEKPPFSSSSSESPMQNEILAAIRDSLEGATPEMVEKITASLSSIAEKRAREIASSLPPQKPSKEANEEEAKPPKQFKFNERPNEEVKNRPRSQFELGDRSDLYNDQNRFNFEPPSYENQVFQQQWNQMMQIGNMRNAQFNMLMHQQEKMMMELGGGNRREQSSPKSSQKKKKSNK